MFKFLHGLRYGTFSLQLDNIINAAATYYIYDAQRRMSIDYDLKDFADF